MRARLALGVAVALIAATPSWAEDPRYDFRGAHMGMTLEEWRAAPAPPQLFAPAAPLCSTDAPTALWAIQTPDSKAAGVVVCIYADARHGSRVGQKVGQAEITGATYYFHGGRLFEIELIGTVEALTPFGDGLNEKFGPPAAQSEATFQTKLGAKFPQVVMTWSRGPDEITLRAPDLRTDRMSVTLRDSAAFSAVEAARKAASGEANKL